jgi:microcompartment protein CcmK/EutM
MRLAYIRGHVTSTVKHPSFTGCRLLIAQPVDRAGKADGAPQIVIDQHGAGIHEQVIICADGAWARDYLKDQTSPCRWWVMGIVDPERSAAS